MIVEVPRFNIGLVLGCLFGGESGGMHGAVVAHPGDDPDVAVGHTEVVVVEPGSDLVADPDSLTAVGDQHTGVVDLSSCDEPLADRLIEIGHLLAGIGHHERTCGGCVVGQRSGA